MSSRWLGGGGESYPAGGWVEEESHVQQVAGWRRRVISSRWLGGGGESYPAGGWVRNAEPRLAVSETVHCLMREALLGTGGHRNVSGLMREAHPWLPFSGNWGTQEWLAWRERPILDDRSL